MDDWGSSPTRRMRYAACAWHSSVDIPLISPKAVRLSMPLSVSINGGVSSMSPHLGRFLEGRLSPSTCPLIDPGTTRPDKTPINVLLPAPFGPMRPTTSPRFAEKQALSNMTWSLKRTYRSSISIDELSMEVAFLACAGYGDSFSALKLPHKEGCNQEKRGADGKDACPGIDGECQ